MASNVLQVRLIFWKGERHGPFDETMTPMTVSNAVAGLWDNQTCRWQYGRCDTFTDVDSGEVKICLTIKHNEFRDNDIRKEEAIAVLCQYLFLETSVLTLDPLLADNNLVMGPFAETSMNANDRIFGRCFSLEQLNQLQCTDGIGFTMKDKMRKSQSFATRNASKWFHAPLYAGLCVTNFFKFIDGSLQDITPQHIDQLAELGDDELKKLVEKGKWVLSCARVFSKWAPSVDAKIQQQIKKLDPADKKAELCARLIPFTSGGNMLRQMMAALGLDDPSVMQSRQIFSTLTGIMAAYEPLQIATLNYKDSCVASTVKSAALTAVGMAMIAGLMIFVPPGGALVAFAGGCVAGGVTSGGGVATVENGIALHRSLRLKTAIRQLYVALMSCRLFLLLILIKTQDCLVTNSDHYQHFKKMIKQQCKADLDKFGEPGYVNLAVNQLVSAINSTIVDMKRDIDAF